MMPFCTEDDGLIDHGSVHSLLSLNLPADHQDTAEGQESIKAKLNAIRNKLVRQVSENEPQLPPDGQLAGGVALVIFTVNVGMGMMLMMPLWTLLTAGFPPHRVPVTLSCTRL